MTFSTEEFGDTPDVDAATLYQTPMSDLFGEFAILSASETDFVRAGNGWRPGEPSPAFLKTYGFDPWVLE